MEEEGFEKLLHLAQSGNAKAQTSVGWLYSEGVGTTVNPAEAVAWYLKAAEQGEPAAQFNLAVAFELGEGVPMDYEAARHWYVLRVVAARWLTRRFAQGFCAARFCSSSVSSVPLW